VEANGCSASEEMRVPLGTLLTELFEKKPH